MKKTYIIPNCKCAELEASDALLAGSEVMGKSVNAINDENSILVKQDVSHKSLWDEEW